MTDASIRRLLRKSTLTAGQRRLLARELNRLLATCECIAMTLAEDCDRVSEELAGEKSTRDVLKRQTRLAQSAGRFTALTDFLDQMEVPCGVDVI